MSDTRTKILDSAERLIRSGGYNNCSFRDIATEIGVKSASIHYHFPTKQDLAVAVARKYAIDFFESLGAPTPAGKGAEDQAALYCDHFRKAYAASGRGCLCGILSNEAAMLPEAVQREIVAFVDANVAWLEKALAGSSKCDSKLVRHKARLIYAALQGALAVSSLMQDGQWLEEVGCEINKSV